jgi:hypothetical protein
VTHGRPGAVPSMMRRFPHAFAVVLAVASVLAATADARQPLVSVAPERGIPGQLVVVTGRGFCGSTGCGRVRIQLYGAVVAAGVEVRTNGTFIHRIRIPGGAPTGEVGLIATQSLPDGSGVEAFADFEMAVRLKAEKAAKSKVAHEASAGRDDGAVVPGADRSPGRVRNQPPGGQSAGPSGSPPAASGRAQAMAGNSDPVDSGSSDVAGLATAAAIVFVLGAALALGVVRSRVSSLPLRRVVSSRREE